MTDLLHFLGKTGAILQLNATRIVTWKKDQFKNKKYIK
jgi:hypothetical protein